MTREFGPVEVQGKQLRCNVCGSATFWEQKVELPTSFLTFLSTEAWDGVAHCAVCGRCGFIHWFVPPTAIAEPIEDIDAAPEGPGAVT